MVRAWLGERVEATTESLLVAIGDAAMIGLFIAIGELRHGGTLAAGIETAGQFGLGWVVAAVAARSYTSMAIRDPWTAATWGVSAWVVAVGIAQGVRLLVGATSRVDPRFLVVSIAFGGLFVGGWRLLAARLLR